eukprot:6173689-Pleurochrysis_carterae.AAC.1
MCQPLLTCNNTRTVALFVLYLSTSRQLESKTATSVAHEKALFAHGYLCLSLLLEEPCIRTRCSARIDESCNSANESCMRPHAELTLFCQERALSTLLNELDGVGERGGVFVLG